MQRLENFKNLIIEHLKTNSIRNKFDMMADNISNFSIFCISESKLDSSIPDSQFKINGYKILIESLLLQWNSYSEGLLLYINGKAARKLLNQKTASSNSEVIAMQFFQTKRKWLLLGVSKPPKEINSEFSETMNILLNDYLETYKIYLLLVISTWLLKILY